MKINFYVLGFTFYLTTFTNAIPFNRISPQDVAGVVIAGNPPSTPGFSNPALANYAPQNYAPQNYINPGSRYIYPAAIAQPANSGNDVLAYLSSTLSKSSPQALEYVHKAVPASIDLPKIGDE